MSALSMSLQMDYESQMKALTRDQHAAQLAAAVGGGSAAHHPTPSAASSSSAAAAASSSSSSSSSHPPLPPSAASSSSTRPVSSNASIAHKYRQQKKQFSLPASSARLQRGAATSAKRKVKAGSKGKTIDGSFFALQIDLLSVNRKESC